jgi:hypothetical protein
MLPCSKTPLPITSDNPYIILLLKYNKKNILAVKGATCCHSKLLSYFQICGHEPNIHPRREVVSTFGFLSGPLV